MRISSISKIALLLAVALVLVSCGGGTPTSPSPANPKWTVITAVKVTPSTTGIGSRVSVEAEYTVNQGGISYQASWWFKDVASGREWKVKDLEPHVTGSPGLAGSQTMLDAPDTVGDYRVIYKRTESLGDQSSTLAPMDAALKTTK